MAAPNVLIMSGYGINCEEETKFAFEKAGAKAEIVHINDIINGMKKLSEYQILAFPGGFSYGDDTGSGNAFANRIKNNFWDKIRKFIDEGNLMIGICNGFQIMANLGLFDVIDDYGVPQVALAHNTSARYYDRWVDLEVHNNSPWLAGIKKISLPIAHGEGRFYAEPNTLKEIDEKKLVALKYFSGEMCEYQNLEANPNGSLNNIAGITDKSGRLLGMMPHPERAIDFTHLPNWTLLKEKFKREGIKIPVEGPGLKIFRNAVDYFG